MLRTTRLRWPWHRLHISTSSSRARRHPATRTSSCFAGFAPCVPTHGHHSHGGKYVNGIIAAMREHAFSYLSRPFSLSSLADMVHAAADGPCWDDGIEVLSATPDWIRLAASCDLRTADRLIQFMHEIADLPQPEADAVAIAFREILMNAIEHGGTFVLTNLWKSLRPSQDILVCRVKDPGEGLRWTKSIMPPLLIRRGSGSAQCISPS